MRFLIVYLLLVFSLAPYSHAIEKTKVPSAQQQQIQNIKNTLYALEQKIALQEEVIYTYWKHYGTLLSNRFLEQATNNHTLIEQYLWHKSEQKLRAHIALKNSYITNHQTQNQQLALLLKQLPTQQTTPNNDTAHSAHNNASTLKSVFVDESQQEYQLLRPFPTYSKKLHLPVNGNAQKHHIKEGSNAQKFLTIAPVFHNKEANIISPYDGVVVFAAPYLQQGYVVIIEHKKGYYSTIIGMDDISVQAGQTILSGEVIGLIYEKESDENTIRVQLQKGTAYLDPVSWYIYH